MWEEGSGGVGIAVVVGGMRRREAGFERDG